MHLICAVGLPKNAGGKAEVSLIYLSPDRLGSESGLYLSNDLARY